MAKLNLRPDFVNLRANMEAGIIAKTGQLPMGFPTAILTAAKAKSAIADKGSIPAGGLMLTFTQGDVDAATINTLRTIAPPPDAAWKAFNTQDINLNCKVGESPFAGRIPADVFMAGADNGGKVKVCLIHTTSEKNGVVSHWYNFKMAVDQTPPKAPTKEELAAQEEEEALAAAAGG